MPETLNYRGVPGTDDMGAFNARTNLFLKGDVLFRVYPYEGKFYFIKVGGSKNNAAAIHLGLIGLIIYLMRKRDARKTRELLTNIVGVPPDQLLGNDKVNHAMEMRLITEPSLNPGSFWGNKPYGSFSFRNEKGKKKVFTFDDPKNFAAASRSLSEALGDRLVVKARFDDVAGKIVKVESARL